ncbi:DUF6608 family protein [Desulfuribacillus alkaliarsenatis]|uniref:Uncharacterized protein n=1 Tax=Desulfuribacillus alkaliarsenatis TaxID=766136 RepID=A0A1E5FYM0_9FIRM|nr:DUF6608 family protein [Desulfuribacillus alkaliarsenatis]OEF95673.1 hypothetical protein BHF68_11235 [Desulfuribacillus alkaliarsenatis]
MLIKNKFSVICIIFTVLTITSSAWNLLNGVTEAGHFHILLRFTIAALAIGSLYIFEWFKKLPFYATHIIHYIATMSAVFLLVWISGFIVELHPDAYRDIFFNYTGIYIIITIVEVVYFQIKRRKEK